MKRINSIKKMEHPNLVKEVNALVAQAIALQQQTNLVEQTDTINLLNISETK
jgi:hypothetical protein